MGIAVYEKLAIDDFGANLTRLLVWRCLGTEWVLTSLPTSGKCKDCVRVRDRVVRRIGILGTGDCNRASLRTSGGGRRYRVPDGDRCAGATLNVIKIAREIVRKSG